MSAASVVSVVALLSALVALLVAIHTRRRLLATQADLAAARAAVEQERRATAESIDAGRRSTVEEVSALVENILAQVDTDITAKVAEALAHSDRMAHSNDLKRAHER